MVSYSRSSDAPSSAPSSPSSPKEVNFAERVVTGISRAASNEEQWAFYWFELHAADCHSCHDPYGRYKAGKRLCGEGSKLAQEVTKHVYCRDGKVYSRIREDGQKVRVEMPPGYNTTSSLLKAVEKGSKNKHPFLSAEKPKEQPQPSRARPHISPRGHHSPKMERAMPLPTSPRGNHSPTMERTVPLPTPRHYPTMPIRQPVQLPQPYPYTEPEHWRYPPTPQQFYEPEESTLRRGSLYDADIARMQDRERRGGQLGYNLEVREPPRHSSSDSRTGHHRSHRHSAFFF